MPKYTSNLNLTKPEPEEFYDVSVNNANCDIIDTAITDISKKMFKYCADFDRQLTTGFYYGKHTTATYASSFDVLMVFKIQHQNYNEAAVQIMYKADYTKPNPPYTPYIRMIKKSTSGSVETDEWQKLAMFSDLISLQSDLQSNISQSVETVQSKLTSEINSRQTADTTLQNSIDNKKMINVMDESSAEGNYSAVIGGQGTVPGVCSVSLGGYSNVVNGERAVAIGGWSLLCNGYNTVCGKNNLEPTAGYYSHNNGDGFIVGNGTLSSRSNAFRAAYSGDVYAMKSINGTGADYAELREWSDGNPNNEDRCGLFVCFDGEKIRLANSEDPKDLLGVISGNPCIVGNNYDDQWSGKYKKDVFGRLLTEHVMWDEETDDNGNIITPAGEGDVYILSEDYDPSQKYIPRKDRPEWGYMGTHGELVVIDDGTCEAKGRCKPNNEAKATAAEDGFYVLERIDDKHIKIFMR